MSVLHNRPPAHHNAPPGTSLVAADQIAEHAPTQEALVFEHILSCGRSGSTDDEGEQALGIKPQSYTPRRNALVKRQLVVDSGERRPTESGRPAAVWLAREFAEHEERLFPGVML